MHDAPNFLDPGPTYLAPGSGFMFGDVGNRRSLLEFLPSKVAADALVLEYYNNVHFVVRTLHWPSFQLQYENFWTSVLSGIEPPASMQAVVLAVMFSAVVSMSDENAASVFGKTKRTVLTSLQTGTEVALCKAQFLRATKTETLQALLIYLLPMCRDEMSRAHSVLVGAAIRLAECMGMHRDPAAGEGLSPVEIHVRRILWFQLCFLDFRTAENQGPRPSIRRDSYDTRFPLNVNDIDLLFARPTESSGWTDMTFTRIRLECNEMHKVAWTDRERLEKKKTSITHVLGKIESFRKAMHAKYDRMFDDNIPIRKYARLVMNILLLRLHIMVLHKYHNHWTMKIPDRLRQIILTSGTQAMEDAVKINRNPEFAQWKWCVGAIQNWHTAFLLLSEVYRFPMRQEADRIWEIVDYVFETNSSLSREQKARSILNTIMKRIAIYRDIRNVGVPDSMRHGISSQPPTKKATSSPPNTIADMIKSGEGPVEGALHNNAMLFRVNIESQYHPDNNSTPSGVSEPGQDWTFDSPSTFYLSKGHRTAEQSTIPGVAPRQHIQYDTSVFHNYDRPEAGNTPSNTSTTDSLPPHVSNEQQTWQSTHQTRSSLSPSMVQQALDWSNDRGSDFTIPFIGEDTPVQPPPQLTRGDSLMLDIDWVRLTSSERFLTH